MRRKVWDGMKVVVCFCVVLPRLTGVERGEEKQVDDDDMDMD
jgi:hypothetical protein